MKRTLCFNIDDTAPIGKQNVMMNSLGVKKVDDNPDTAANRGNPANGHVLAA